MVRPKKNLNTPEARQRMIDSFWELLEEYRYGEITVGMIVNRAGCSGGTFYYHFDSIEDLLYSALEDEFLNDSGFIADCLNLLTGADATAANNMLNEDRLQHVFLAVRQGASEQVSSSVKSIILDMWRTILCPDGEELAQDTRLIIEYTYSGTLGVLTYYEEKLGKGEDVNINLDLVSEVSSSMLERISEAQGVPVDEILARLKILTQFSKISSS